MTLKNEYKTLKDTFATLTAKNKVQVVLQASAASIMVLGGLSGGSPLLFGAAMCMGVAALMTMANENNHKAKPAFSKNTPAAGL